MCNKEKFWPLLCEKLGHDEWSHDPRFAGFAARIEMRMPIEGRRRFNGRLLGLDGDLVRLATESGDVALPFADLAKAKLVLTDELLAAHRAQSKD